MAVLECACVLTSVHVCMSGFFLNLLVCICMCVIVHVSWFIVYLCDSWQRRQGIMNCAFISLCTAPFTYPHGKDDGVELACQCKCFAVLHAVSVLWLAKVLNLESRLCGTLIWLISLAFSCCDGH